MSQQVSNLKIIQKDLLKGLEQARIMNENVRGLLVMKNEEC